MMDNSELKKNAKFPCPPQAVSGQIKMIYSDYNTIKIQKF